MKHLIERKVIAVCALFTAATCIHAGNGIYHHLPINNGISWTYVETCYVSTQSSYFIEIPPPGPYIPSHIVTTRLHIDSIQEDPDSTCIMMTEDISVKFLKFTSTVEEFSNDSVSAQLDTTRHLSLTAKFITNHTGESYLFPHYQAYGPYVKVPSDDTSRTLYTKIDPMFSTIMQHHNVKGTFPIELEQNHYAGISQFATRREGITRDTVITYWYSEKMGLLHKKGFELLAWCDSSLNCMDMISQLEALHSVSLSSSRRLKALPSIRMNGKVTTVRFDFLGRRIVGEQQLRNSAVPAIEVNGSKIKKVFPLKAYTQ